MTARLLEAIQRGLWEHPSVETHHALQQAFLASESAVESRAE
jgi:cobalamin biosynthesis Mg chelatase CobN